MLHVETCVCWFVCGFGVGRLSVHELQAEIDRVAGAAQWVLRDGQSVRNQPR
jgi:hypothetical protein